MQTVIAVSPLIENDVAEEAVGRPQLSNIASCSPVVAAEQEAEVVGIQA